MLLGKVMFAGNVMFAVEFRPAAPAPEVEFVPLPTPPLSGAELLLAGCDPFWFAFCVTFWDPGTTWNVVFWAVEPFDAGDVPPVAGDDSLLVAGADPFEALPLPVIPEANPSAPGGAVPPALREGAASP
jgi:hypothetical protein